MSSILLVNPPLQNDGVYGGPPFGLTLLATHLNNRKLNVEVIDLVPLVSKGKLSQISESEMIVYIKKGKCSKKLWHNLHFISKQLQKSNYKNLGFTIHDKYEFFYCLAIAKFIKRRIDCNIILGGFYISSSDLSFLNLYPFVDLIVKGYGEKTLEKYLKGHHLRNIPGISYRYKNKIYSKEPSKIKSIEDMDLPDYSFFKKSNYLIKSQKTKQFLIPYIINKGCNGKCKFCASHTYLKQIGNCIQYKSGIKVANEIRQLMKQNNSKYFIFCDDAINTNPKQLENVLDSLIYHRYNIYWGSFARADLITKDLAKKLSRSGCKYLVFGCESGSQKILNKMRKGTNTKTMQKTLANTYNNGILNFGYFMVNFPGETWNDFLRTVAFILKNHRKFYGVYCFEYHNREGSQLFIEQDPLTPDNDTFIGKIKIKLIQYLVAPFITASNIISILRINPKHIFTYIKLQLRDVPFPEYYFTYYDIINKKL